MNDHHAGRSICSFASKLALPLGCTVFLLWVGAEAISNSRRLSAEIKRDQARVAVMNWSILVEDYKRRFGEFPESLAVLAQTLPDGGEPYVDVSALLDPWGREYQYDPEGPHNRPFGKADIWSLGSHPDDPSSSIGNW